MSDPLSTTGFLAALVGLIVSVATTLFARYKRIQFAHRELELRDPEELLSRFKDLDEVQREVAATLLSQIAREARIGSQADSDSNDAEVEVETAVNLKLEELRDRIDSIDARFPESSKIEKYTSINDALFEERITQLNARIESLESKSLSKWDVAMVVSTILAGISAVVMAVYGLLALLGIQPGT